MALAGYLAEKEGVYEISTGNMVLAHKDVRQRPRRGSRGPLIINPNLALGG